MKDYEKLSKEHFDKQAPVYDETNTMYYSKEGKISCNDVADYLSDKEYSSFLDVGCGTGYLLDLLSKKKEAEYHGLDLSDKMIEVALSKNIPGASFVVGKSDSLPYPDNSMDVVTCIQSFHHYPRRNEAVQEALRVLRPSGLYILSDSGIGGVGGWIDNNIIFKLMKSGDCHVDGMDGIAKLMEKNGLNVIEKKKLSRMVYTVIGKKP